VEGIVKGWVEGIVEWCMEGLRGVWNDSNQMNQEALS
jgi:hypothetical protein